MPSVAVPSINGTGNNVDHPEWGSVGVDLIRTAPAAYADGASTPAGADRPSARAISNALAAQGESIPNDRDMSDYVYAWGQFLDHDLDLTTTAASPSQPFNIAVPTGDPSFDPASTGTKVIPLNRSSSDPATGTSASNPRQQVNTVTAFIDGSQIYGSDSVRAAALRTFSGGLLKTSADNLLPVNDVGLPNANDAHIAADNTLFLAGDVRANENVELTAMQTLFVREHNRLAGIIAAAHADWTDEQVFQHARSMVVGELQAITYNEFLPAILGPASLGPYRGYNPDVNPGIANEFSTAAFRFGHSLLNDDVEFLDNQGNDVHDEIALAQAFFNPDVLRQTGIDPVLKYLASDEAQEIDNKVIDGLRNFLFGPPGAGGLDLAALNIQRGRDHGLADYNTTRAAYGLPKITSFAQLTSDANLQAALASTYGSVDKIDLWVGLLAEDHLPGASVGALERRILASQFRRLRDGDRFWYQATLSRAEQQVVENTKLSDIIRLNTTTKNIQDNVFFFKTAVYGQVYADTNADGKRQPGEAGAPKVTLNLVDEDGLVVQTTKTDPRGQFEFEGVGLGTYKLVVVPDAGWTVSGKAPDPITFTRGMEIRGLMYSVVPPAGTQTPAPPTTPDRPHRPPPRDGGGFVQQTTTNGTTPPPPGNNNLPPGTPPGNHPGTPPGTQPGTQTGQTPPGQPPTGHENAPPPPPQTPPTGGTTLGIHPPVRADNFHLTLETDDDDDMLGLRTLTRA
ncbi:MAG: peroxidase [Planctomycetota bacterium]|nr:peroxidase [Planctomycetota bacterium]